MSQIDNKKLNYTIPNLYRHPITYGTKENIDHKIPLKPLPKVKI